MAIATLTALNSALPGQRIDLFKSSTTPQASATWLSFWAVGGKIAAGSTPSSGLGGDVPTSATTGAIAFVNPASGITQLGRVEWDGNVAGGGVGMIALYDRLWHNSGIDATSTGAQTINSTALTRPDASGTGADAWWHVYATMGAATPTVTLTYTNSGNTGSRSGTSGVLVTGMTAGRTGQFQLAAGDVGVKSIQTWQADASFVSGTIDLVIRRLVALMPLTWGMRNSYDGIALGLPRIYDGACLEILFLGSSLAVAPNGQLHLVNG